jgi:hypothetical protein
MPFQGAQSVKNLETISGSYEVLVDGIPIGKAENGKIILPLGTKNEVRITLKRQAGLLSFVVGFSVCDLKRNELCYKVESFMLASAY